MKKLFIHIPKNGGTSLRLTKTNIKVNDYKNSLSLNHADVIKQLDTVGLKPSYGHARLRDFSKSEIKNYRPFCIVRNPWDREVSKYKFLLNSMNDKNQKIANRRDLIAEYGYDSDGTTILTFERYLDIRIKFRNVPYTWLHAVENFWSQKSYIIDHDGDINCDVLRFEDYDYDIKNYLGISVREKANQMKKDDYRKYYISTTYDIVADLYAEDIDYFGFEFESSATKNYWTK